MKHGRYMHLPRKQEIAGSIPAIGSQRNARAAACSGAMNSSQHRYTNRIAAALRIQPKATTVVDTIEATNRATMNMIPAYTSHAIKTRVLPRTPVD